MLELLSCALLPLSGTYFLCYSVKTKQFQTAGNEICLPAELFLSLMCSVFDKLQLAAWCHTSA